MPIYEYVCDECGEKFDLLRTMGKADSPAPCKQCSSNHTHRLISVFFARSEGRSVTSGASNCGGCSGGSCGSCRH